jgi:PAS domain S-box-containing protein
MGTGQGLQGMTKYGDRVAVEIGLNSVDIDGQQCIVASVLDVSPLRGEQEKTRLAIDASASAMIMLDSTNKIVLVNSQAVAMFGYQEQQLLGQPIEVLVPERYRRRHDVYRGSYTADPTQRAMGGDRALHGLRADGSEFPLEIGLTPIDDHGRLMIMATVINITERTKAEDEIKRQTADLVRLNAELAQFAYSASHDLKAPLATLDGILMCLQDDLDDNDIGSARANSVRAQELSRRLAQLIEGILGFARAENLENEIDEVDICDLVETVKRDLQAAFADSGVELRNKVSEGTALPSDRRRLTQILENLLSNGAKFCNRQLVERFVSVEAGTEDDELVVCIRDNGIGIPIDSQGKVFTMFRRFKNHDREGTGLGLALVKQHVDHLGGSITFDSTAAGTTFSIRLPSSEQREPATTGREAASA